MTIVVGVLVALGLGAWAETLSEHRLEREYLYRLAAELGGLAEVKPVAGASAGGLQLNYYEAVALHGSAAAEGLAALPSDPEDLAGLVASAYAAAWQVRPHFPSTTYQELLATGRLRLLRDRGFRTALIEFYDAAELWGGFFEESSDRGYRTFVRGSVPPDVNLGDQCDPVATVPLACRPDLHGWAPLPFLTGLRDNDAIVRLLNLKVSEYRRNAGVVRSFIARADSLAAIAERLAR